VDEIVAVYLRIGGSENYLKLTAFREIKKGFLAGFL